MFFCNSGAEAIEGGIKLIRKYQYVNGKPQRYKLICFQAAFHGRLLNALAATGNEKYLEGFGPPAPGYRHAPLNNANVVRDMIDDETAGILVEPIQGEGGVRETTPEFLKALRAICDEYGLLLFYDEIHTGFGRTGKLFAYEWSGVAPDVMAIAKGMGGGFPIGAFMATEKAAVGMVPGTHGSTYGGNPLATGVANAVLDVLLKPGFIEGVHERGEYLKGQLAGAGQDAIPRSSPRRAASGFLQGLRCEVPAGDMVDRLHVAGHAGADRGRERDPHLPGADRRQGGARRGCRHPGEGRAVVRGGPGCEQGRRVAAWRHRSISSTSTRSMPKTLRQILDRGKAMKKARAERRTRQAARRQDARHDLREALDTHPRVVRGRHARARRPDDHAGPHRHPARARRDHRRHRARAVAATSTSS